MIIFIKIVIMALVIIAMLFAYAAGAIMEENEAISGTYNPLYKAKLTSAFRKLAAVCGAIFLTVAILMVLAL